MTVTDEQTTTPVGVFSTSWRLSPARFKSPNLSTESLTSHIMQQANRCTKSGRYLYAVDMNKNLFWGWITVINNLVRTLRWTSRLRLVLHTRLLLLYRMLMLRVVQVCRMLLLLLLLPDVLLVGWLLIVICSRGVVLIKRLLVNRRLPVDRQLSHDGLIPGAFWVVARVVIWHHILRLRVLLAGLVPRKERSSKRLKRDGGGRRAKRRNRTRTQQERTNYVWRSMGCVEKWVRQTYKTQYLQTYMRWHTPVCIVCISFIM